MTAGEIPESVAGLACITSSDHILGAYFQKACGTAVALIGLESSQHFRWQSAFLFFFKGSFW